MWCRSARHGNIAVAADRVAPDAAGLPHQPSAAAKALRALAEPRGCYKFLPFGFLPTLEAAALLGFGDTDFVGGREIAPKGGDHGVVEAAFPGGERPPRNALIAS